MKIIEQSHKIISLPEKLLETLELAGRTCYKSEDKIGCTLPGKVTCPDKMFEMEGDMCIKTLHCSAKCEYHSSHKFIQTIIKRGHHAMIEFGDIVVRFITNRGVTHEIVRHRMCSFAQESTRYVKYDGTMEFIKPVWINNKIDIYKGCFHHNKNLSASENLTMSIWANTVKSTELDYKELLNQGWRPEQAREVLPNSLKTEIVVKANIREWRHIFTLRCSKAAHPQMRALMVPLLKELKEKLPIVFDDILGE